MYCKLYRNANPRAWSSNQSMKTSNTVLYHMQHWAQENYELSYAALELGVVNFIRYDLGAESDKSDT